MPNSGGNNPPGANAHTTPIPRASRHPVPRISRTRRLPMAQSRWGQLPDQPECRKSGGEFVQSRRTPNRGTAANQPNNPPAPATNPNAVNGTTQPNASPSTQPPGADPQGQPGATQSQGTQPQPGTKPTTPPSDGSYPSEKDRQPKNAGQDAANGQRPQAGGNPQNPSQAGNPQTGMNNPQRPGGAASQSQGIPAMPRAESRRSKAAIRTVRTTAARPPIRRSRKAVSSRAARTIPRTASQAQPIRKVRTPSNPAAPQGTSRGCRIRPVTPPARSRPANRVGSRKTRPIPITPPRPGTASKATTPGSLRTTRTNRRKPDSRGIRRITARSGPADR